MAIFLPSCRMLQIRPWKFYVAKTKKMWADMICSCGGRDLVLTLIWGTKPDALLV
ncbi:hypothetical protein RchiOBHm_Chr5g0053981 [Rosa chinensis]|uniref:Uncharacterized protein n=1 Tax=Rosa chinensis TaxID=74649 RepID=A0A2P6QG25_ROSCH|nr:hypothetical protein RchiOBHm_Chr5g0053981 [Rosa chinensis]